MIIHKCFCAGTTILVLAGCGDQAMSSGNKATSAPADERMQPALIRVDPPKGEAVVASANPPTISIPAPRKELQPYVEKGIEWLVKAQHADGGWGAGSHANQTELNPHAVLADPATTAFAAIALLRAGNTFDDGKYSKALRNAAGFLLTAVEKAPNTPGLITDLQGTQIQTKLGPMIDTSMALQFFSRALLTLKSDDPLAARVKNASAVCVAKLQESQAKDGSWNTGGGWAPVLQSSLSCSALEYAKASNQTGVDENGLKRARDFQKGNWAASKAPVVATVSGGKATFAATSTVSGNAGVELYSFAGAQRGNAADSRRANEVWKKALDEGKFNKTEAITEEKLATIVPTEDAFVLNNAVVQSKEQEKRLTDEQLLAGFGNNGGEEYLSYLLSGESLVIEGGDKFQKWIGPMTERFKKVQNPDGSWSGHHCISSAVFCTSAVVQCATVDCDWMLQKVIAVSAEAQKK